MNLVTYGETGQVCQNWMQYRLIKKYLEDYDRRSNSCNRVRTSTWTYLNHNQMLQELL